MTLRRRTVFVVLAARGAAIVVLSFALQGILSAHSATLEKQKANQDLERVSAALSLDIADPERLGED